MKAVKEVGAVMTTLEQVLQKMDGLKNEKEAATQDFGEFCRGTDRVEYEQNGLQAKQQFAQRVREKCVNSVGCVQCGVFELQESVAKHSFASQKQIEDLWVCVCDHFGGLLAELVVQARQDQSRDAGEVANLYTESWKNRPKRSQHPVLDPSYVGDVQAMRVTASFKGTDISNKFLISPGDDENEAGVGALFCVTLD